MRTGEDGDREDAQSHGNATNATPSSRSVSGARSAAGNHAVPEAEVQSLLRDSRSCLDTDKNDIVVVGEEFPDQTLRADWLPLTLRLPYLTFLIALSSGLGILVLVLLLLSARNDGLGNEKDSSTLFFGWRFSPTLIATAYAILVGSMLNDIRRTEIFARLSRYGGAAAAYTLCFPVRSWWNDPFDALSKRKNNGVRSFALFSASIANILVLLVVSPLSAGLLSPVSITTVRNTIFHKAQPAANLSWQTDAFDTVGFRTIASSILNKTTSAWVNPQFAVLPFWPSHTDSPTGASFFTEFGSQQWKSHTTVFKTELDCEPLDVVNFSEANSTTDASALTTVRFSSADGCNMTIAEDYQTSHFYYGGWMKGDHASWPRTGNCGDRSTILVKSLVGNSFVSAGFKSTGYICKANFFSANVNVTVSISEEATSVDFDNDEFMTQRSSLDPIKYDLSHLEDNFLQTNWSKKFFSTTTLVIPPYTGPLLAIAADPDYNNDAGTIINSSSLLEKASRLHQQYFGEMLLPTLNTASDHVDSGSGEIMILERRIIVVSSIAVTLVVLLFVSCGCTIMVAYTTRLAQRTLHLYQDPGSITAVAALIATDRNARNEFQDADKVSNDALMVLLAEHQFKIEHGRLLSADSVKSPSQDGKSPLTITSSHIADRSHLENSSSDSHIISETSTSDPRPMMIRIWMASMLLTIFVVLVGVLISLYILSREGRLHQTVLVKALNLHALKLSTTLTPYSIIPTLIAVGLKLWFKAAAETFKRLHPFISMVKSPAPVSASISAEYANTPITFVTIKAFKHSHWLLALIGVGALVTEAFTVGMSALWDREIRNISHAFNVSRQLEVRSTPQIFTFIQRGSNAAQKSVLSSVFDASLQNWLYGATIEVTQLASTPPWSKDTWSFPPLNPEITREATSRANSTARNITLVTPALRGRLECVPVDIPSEIPTWLGEVDLKNKSKWHDTLIPEGFDLAYYLNDTASEGPGLRDVVCCENITHDGVGNSVVGYWSDPLTGQVSTTRIKWIYGQPLGTLPVDKYGLDRLIWSKPPRVTAIDCKPVIEVANASIVIDFETGVVQDYTILSPPQNATMAWLDYYSYHGTDTSYQAHWSTNVTTSWGYIFWDSLLGASHAADLLDERLFYAGPEDLSDGVFNLRGPGLNVDFMSYSMLAMANNSKEALLDSDTLTKLANQTFGIFFKHFASEEVNSTAGGRVFQPIGEKLPSGIGPVTISGNITADQGALGLQDSAMPLPREIEAVLLTPVEQLVMSPIAFYLSTSLLVFLIFTTIIMYSVNRAQYKALPRDVDTLASMIAFVHGSDKLLAWSEDLTRSGAWYKFWSRKKESLESQGLKAQMGTFKDGEGKEKWGIELVDTIAPSPPSEFTNHSDVEMQSLRSVQSGDGKDHDPHAVLLGDFDWEGVHQPRTTMHEDDVSDQGDNIANRLLGQRKNR
ncbi:hypothetical protein E4T39_04140 [Aureobasidium subglaciale]|nr:hypothetical protein E4T39_04140 [Aureobasidium subglaciale]